MPEPMGNADFGGRGPMRILGGGDRKVEESEVSKRRGRFADHLLDACRLLPILLGRLALGIKNNPTTRKTLLEWFAKFRRVPTEEKLEHSSSLGRVVVVLSLLPSLSSLSSPLPNPFQQ